MLFGDGKSMRDLLMILIAGCEVRMGLNMKFRMVEEVL